MTAKEYLSTDLSQWVTVLDHAHMNLSFLRDIMALTGDMLESEECSSYAAQYSSVMNLAIDAVNKLCEDMERTSDEIAVHNKARQVICGEETK